MDRGKVIRISGEFAFIEMELNESCSSCSNKGVCMAGGRPAELKVENTGELKEGDIVEIDLAPKAKLTAGFLLFIFPIITIILFYYLAFSIYSTEKAGILGALTGLASGVAAVYGVNRTVSNNRYFKPRSIRKIIK